jgi:hypothetical protein
MRILALKVDWHEKFANDPSLKVLVNKMPEREELRYLCLEERMYFAEKDGYVNFFVHQPRDETGYGGRTFNVTMLDGTKRSIKGPWSSRSGCFNRMLNIPQCVECAITDDPTTYQRGFTFYAAAITVDLVREHMKSHLPGLEMRREVKWEGEVYYIPHPIGVDVKDAKRVGIEKFPFKNDSSHQYVSSVQVVHISKPLKEIQDDTAKRAFGSTKGEVQEDMLCISCKLPVVNRIRTDLGWKEYGISGLCEICWDDITKPKGGE